MTPFDYVSVILSVVISLAFTHVLTGIVRLIQARDVKVSLVWAGWIGLMLFWCVDYWFSTWQLHKADVWTLGFVGFLLLMATALYIACGLAMPSEAGHDERIDLQAFHNTNRRRYLAALFGYHGLAIFGNLSIAPLESAALVSVAELAIIAAAWTWNDNRIQAAAVIAMWAVNIWYAWNFIPQL
jgi:hypothetical protein